MKDPVILPSSRITVDRPVIQRHLLSDSVSVHFWPFVPHYWCSYREEVPWFMLFCLVGCADWSIQPFSSYRGYVDSRRWAKSKNWGVCQVSGNEETLKPTEHQGHNSDYKWGNNVDWLGKYLEFPKLSNEIWIRAMRIKLDVEP